MIYLVEVMSPKRCKLQVPPGSQLEARKGAQTGQHSIRINDQWRICFVWTPADPSGIEIMDYH